MRVTTGYTFNASVDTLQRRQQELVERQLQLTSGKRVQRASDDPTAAARAERALAGISRAEADQRAAEASRNALTLTESALGDASELLQQARELVVAAGNPAYGLSERLALATQLEGIREQLLNVANRRDESGGYLFFPASSGPPPLSGTPVVYAGPPIQAERMTSGLEPLPLNVDGTAAWQIDTNTLPYSSALFDGLDQAISALQQNPPATPGATIADDGITSIDSSLGSLLQLRARVGELLNRADMIEGRVADSRLYNQSERSAAEDLDLVQAISDFQNKQTGYDAALKAYSMVQRMSLFQYLNG